MLDFLHSSTRIATNVHQIVKECLQAKERVKQNKIDEAIELLNEISSEESDLYKKIKRNREGLALEVLEEEITKTLVIAKRIIQFLQNGETEEALSLLEVLIQRELDEQRLVKERIAVKEHDEELGKKIQPILKKYIKKGYHVIELFNGERSDILRALANIVGESGAVYGIDSLNPFSHHTNMVEVNSLPNVELIKATFPRVHIQKADAVIIREFHYIQSNSEGYLRKLDSLIKKKGLLLVFLNHTEFHQEKKLKSYSTIISQMTGYRQIAFDKFELAYRKD